MSWSHSRFRPQRRQLGERRGSLRAVRENSNQIGAKVRDQDVFLAWIQDDLVKVASVLPVRYRSRDVGCRVYDLCWILQGAVCWESVYCYCRFVAVLLSGQSKRQLQDKHILASTDISSLTFHKVKILSGNTRERCINAIDFTQHSLFTDAERVE